MFGSKQLSLGSQNCSSKNCTRCWYFEDCGGCHGECANCAIYCTRDSCAGCGNFCASDERTWDQELQGLGFDNIQATIQSLPKLPKIIPQLVYGWDGDPVNPPFVGIPFRQILDEKARIKITSEHQLRKMFKVAKRVKLILLGNAKDDVLEKFWVNRKKEQFKWLKQLNFHLATALCYSVYGDAARKEHILNLKRSLKTFQLMQESGIKAIPHMYFYSRRDIERWAQWLQKNSCVGSVALCLQFRLTKKQAYYVAESLKQLQDMSGRSLHFLVMGKATLEAFQIFMEKLRNLSFTTADIAHSAFRGKQIIQKEGKRKKVKRDDLSKGKLFKMNLQFYQRIVNEHQGFRI